MPRTKACALQSDVRAILLSRGAKSQKHDKACKHNRASSQNVNPPFLNVGLRFQPRWSGNTNRFCTRYWHLRCQSGVCPCDEVKYLSERGLRNGSRRLRKMDGRASQRMEFDRCRHFDISSGALCPWTISDQTYFEEHDTPSQRTAQMECRALRHTIRPLPNSATFFRSVLPLHYILSDISTV